MQAKLLFLLGLIPITLACWLFMAGIFESQPMWSPLLGLLIIALFCSLLTYALVRAARQGYPLLWILLGLLSFAALCLPASFLMELFKGDSLPLDSPMGIFLFSIASIALVIAGLLLHSSLYSYDVWRGLKTEQDTNLRTQRRRVGWFFGVSAVLCAILLGRSFYNFYWLFIWDKTGDALDFLWLFIPLLALLYAGILLLIILPARRQFAGFAYPALVLVTVILVFSSAQQVDWRLLTAVRAERVNQALQTYYTRNGHYPDSLSDLTPWYMLKIPEPVIIYGQEWCYRGEGDFYQLGYVTREHWSNPNLGGRIYDTQGVDPKNQPACQAEVAAIQERYPQYPYTYLGSE